MAAGKSQQKHWHVVHTIELGASAQTIWEIIGGFFTIHKWHPDISSTSVPEDQANVSAIRRLMTFPGQPSAIDELISQDNIAFHCCYKWYKGPWGEHVQEYVSNLRAFESHMGRRCIVQWAATFLCTEDAVSDFYLRGLRALAERFPVKSDS